MAKTPVLKLSQLIDRSELICIAVIKEKTVVSKDSDSISTVKSACVSEKVFKGKWDLRKQIPIITYDRPGKREDDWRMPLKGERAVLFLQADEENKGTFSPVNGKQGVWVLDEKNSPTGMGFGNSLSELEKQIKSQEKK